jgi:glucose/arabinose dehydrogenase
MFRKDMLFGAFVAHHGSWNCAIPDGYQVARVRFDEKGRARSWEPFAEGWLQGPRSWARPAGVNELPDGSLLVSDDKQGVISQISYTP